MKQDVLTGLTLLAILCAVPVGVDAYWLRLGTTMLMYGVLAMSWNFVGGMAGYPSFASAAFFGLGAYAGAVAQKFGLSMFLAWGLAGAVAAVFAAALGFALLRLRGHYFAIASLQAGAVRLAGGGRITRCRRCPIATVFFYAMLASAPPSAPFVTRRAWIRARYIR